MRLKRSQDKIIAGVCSGLADSFNIDPTVIRIVYALVTIFSAAFPGILIYLILWFVMPAPDLGQTTLNAGPEE